MIVVRIIERYYEAQIYRTINNHRESLSAGDENCIRRCVHVCVCVYTAGLSIGGINCPSSYARNLYASWEVVRWLAFDCTRDPNKCRELLAA